MRNILSFLALSGLFFASCSGSSVESPLVYDSGIWETFQEGETVGLSVKGDPSCWIDFSAELTKPQEFWNYTTETFENGITFYSLEGATTPEYVSFESNGTTYYGSVSLDNPDTCVGDLSNLGEMNS